MPQLSAARTVALAAALSVAAFGLLFVAGRAARGDGAVAQQTRPASARVPVSASPEVAPLRTVAALPGLRTPHRPRPPAPAPAPAPAPPPKQADPKRTQSTQPDAHPTFTAPAPIPVPVAPAPAPARPAPKPSRPPAGGQFDDSG